MAYKRKDTVDFRFYEIPQGEYVLVMEGEAWVRVYGHDDTRLHFHNYTEIGICRWGAGVMMYDECRYRYTDGTVTIIPEKYPHNTVSDGEGPNFWEYIFFDMKAVLEELFPDDALLRGRLRKILNSKAFIGDGADHPELVAAIDAIVHEYHCKHPMYRKQTLNYLRALVMELIRINDAGTLAEEQGIRASNMPQISEALEYIVDNCNNPITAADLAGMCNMSETHFRRVFVEYMNMTPMDYVNLCRIQYACDMMKKSDDSMDAVATACGFMTTSTFNRNFKKFLGISPYQWKINPQNYEHKLLNYRISALKGW